MNHFCRGIYDERRMPLQMLSYIVPITLEFIYRCTGVNIVRAAGTVCRLISVHFMPKTVELQKGIRYTMFQEWHIY